MFDLQNETTPARSAIHDKWCVHIQTVGQVLAWVCGNNSRAIFQLWRDSWRFTSRRACQKHLAQTLNDAKSNGTRIGIVTVAVIRVIARLHSHTTETLYCYAFYTFECLSCIGYSVLRSWWIVALPCYIRVQLMSNNHMTLRVLPSDAHRWISALEIVSVCWIACRFWCMATAGWILGDWCPGVAKTAFGGV